MAIVAVVVGEYLGASNGIGYLIAQAEGVFDTTGMFAGMAVLAFTVLLIGAVVGKVERRLLRWKALPDSFALDRTAQKFHGRSDDRMTQRRSFSIYTQGKESCVVHRASS